MSNKEVNSENSGKKNDKFDVVILGNLDKSEKLFINTFPILLSNSNDRHKYLNRYDLWIREIISFSKDFINIYNPEFLDNLMNIDILILTYNFANKLSFEYLKTFYYLYYAKLDNKSKPKTIIIIERDYTKNDEMNYEEKVDSKEAEKLANLYNGYFCDNETDEAKLTEILNECLNKLLKINKYVDDYSSFKYKELNKEVNSFILIYGDKNSQQKFLHILLQSKCNFNYKKIKDNFYEIKYDKIINDNKLSFKIILKLVSNEYNYDSECNILLYDINELKSYNSIKNLIRRLIKTNGAKFKKIYNLISLNNSSTTPLSVEENNNQIKEGKNLAFEIGANFSIINVNNNNTLNEEIKIKFDNILEQIINCINMSKNNNSESVSRNSTLICENEDDDFIELGNYDSSTFFIKEVNNRIKNIFKGSHSSFFNICPNCYSQLDIEINDSSNIIIMYCNKCKYEPKGIDIDTFIDKNKEKCIKYHCKLCQNSLNYDFKSSQLFCGCEFNLIEKNGRARSLTTKKNEKYELIQIPLFLKDCYCEKHNLFNQYYLKYSKKGLCEKCSKEKSNCFIEKFIKNEINELYKKKNEELQKEQIFINNIQNIFNDCLNSLQLLFRKYIGIKIKNHIIKSEILRNIQIIQNNYTFISNVKNLKFDKGENFKYDVKDTLENRIKYIFNYLNYEGNISNLYFQNNDNKDAKIHIKGPYNNLTLNEKDKNITDMCGLKNNELICISYNDGKAKIFELNNIEKNYPKYIINAFLPDQGINSMLVSRNENNILKINNTNKNEIIYLNGYEEIKIIQMNHNYTAHENLYSIKYEQNNISSSIELDNNNILSLTASNNLILINLNKNENNEIKNEIKDINHLLIGIDKTIVSINKIAEKIICLQFSNIDIELSFRQSCARISLYEENEDEDNLSKTYTLEEDFNNKEKNISLGERENIPNTKNNKNEEKLIKIFTFNINNKQLNTRNEVEEEDNLDLDIQKEYIFPKNYQVLSCISEEKQLLLLKNYIKEENNIIKENNFYIFDYNICQIIYSFKSYNKWLNCQYYIKWNYDKIIDKQGYLIMDENLNIIQYFFDENYTNYLYYINGLKIEKNTKNQLSKILELGNKMIVYCKNKNYYLISSN